MNVIEKDGELFDFATTRDTKQFGLVLSSICGEDDLDLLDRFLKVLSLEFAEDSSKFTPNGNLYLQCHTELISKSSCLFNNVLPMVYESQEAANSAIERISRNSGISNTKVFDKMEVIDLNSFITFIRENPFDFSFHNDINFKKKERTLTVNLKHLDMKRLESDVLALVKAKGINLSLGETYSIKCQYAQLENVVHDSIQNLKLEIISELCKEIALRNTSQEINNQSLNLNDIIEVISRVKS